ncbi:MAG: M20 family metallopeptidase [Chloroflexi bacterium]|nr:M20 family metallopeptidase [Chloroflexota bacterium]
MVNERLKASVIAEINSREQELGELSRKIHENPETAFQETKAVAWLTQYLSDNGFSIEKGICALPTAFRASYGRGKPALALLAEYDALPKIGHACGHNIIATSAVGAAVAAKHAVAELGGQVLVFGTPAEEGQGGKILMADRGGFDNIDAAMIVHPGSHNTATTFALAAQGLTVEFFGKAAHAAASPEQGINALDAMLLSFAAINGLRQHIKSKARIHGIITDGGQAANIVPAHTAADFLVRADEDKYLDELKKRVINCFQGGAMATGARLEYKWSDVRYATMKNNMTLARLFKQNMESLGRKIRLYEASEGSGSTDMGNVSHLVPSIHPFVAIAPRGAAVHTIEFAAAAASETGMRGLHDAAKALALTVVDLLANPKTVRQARKEFQEE